MAKRNDKRNRLVKAADKLFHEQGINITTLANIATLADVPLGNVYYYFKSKDAIILAVIEYRQNLLKQQFEGLNSLSDTKLRLQSLIKQTAANSDYTASYGDVLGSLCQELGKQGGSVSDKASELMTEIVSWCEAQFRALGKGEQSIQYAQHLVSGLQGISLMTLSMNDPSFIERQTDFLIDWLEITIKQQ